MARMTKPNSINVLRSSYLWNFVMFLRNDEWTPKMEYINLVKHCVHKNASLVCT